MLYQSVQFKYGYFSSTKELKTFNPDITTGELRSNARGNVAVLRGRQLEKKKKGFTGEEGGQR